MDAKERTKQLPVFAVVVALMLSGVSIILAQAQQDDITEGRIAGEQAAEENINGTLWFCLGFGLPGLVIAYIHEPDPPALALLGKPPEYVSAYTEAYKATAKKTQSRNAVRGCVAHLLLTIVEFVILFRTGWIPEPPEPM